MLAALVSSCGEARAPRPDVIVIVIDTLRADRLGCYGNQRPTSPVIDGLASEGVVFEQVTAQASWTLTSMPSMWTGRYLTDHREFPDEDWPTLAEAFRAAGYRTLGSTANALLDERRGYARGFEAYDRRKAHDGLDGYRPAEQLVADLWGPIDEAIAPAADGSRAPLLLYLQPLDPHLPYKPHPEHEDELPRAGARAFEPPGWHAAQLDAHGHEAPAGDPDWSRALAGLVTRRGVYEQEVRHVDDQLGVLLDGLRERGLLEHAVIAIVSDHGEGLWDHVLAVSDEELAKLPPARFFFPSHGYNLYEEAIATPFVLWGAGLPSGVRVAQPVENIDLFPTLLELADVPALGDLDGRSLVAAAHGEGPAARRYTYSFVRQCRAVHDHERDFKLIDPTPYGERKGLRPELYRVSRDPLERRDLAAEFPEEVLRLRRELESWTLAHPTRTTAGTQRSSEELQALQALGYTGEHAPELEGSGGQRETQE